MSITLEQYEKMTPVIDGEIEGVKVTFVTPNQMTAWRVQSLFEKEPITIEWLNRMKAGEVLVDIGANVGMYSIYAALVRGVTVHAFEPESQNFALLNRNIFENKLDHMVTAYPLAVSDAIQLNQLYLSTFDLGMSCHSFGEEVGFDLETRPSAFKQGSFSLSLDEVVGSQSVPAPDHIKIDVDGIEHLVIAGMQQTLKSGKVRTVLVELNTNLEEHRGVFTTMQELGFAYDETQVQAALRKTGAFEGVGEVLFERQVDAVQAPSTSEDEPAFLSASQKVENDTARFSRQIHVQMPQRSEAREVLRHVIHRLNETEVSTDPFPHIVIDNVFPDWYYDTIKECFPDVQKFIPIAETGRVQSADGKAAYPDRTCILFDAEHLGRIPMPEREFWIDLGTWLHSDSFVMSFIDKFADVLDDRFQGICGTGSPLSVRGDSLLISDRTNYSIGPHTDAPHRLISFLFYLPPDDTDKDLGTSLYQPIDPDFHCEGGPHHSFDKFTRAKTFDFVPNRLVAFPKTAQCFHGVEPIERENVERRLLISNIRIMNARKF